MKEKQKNENRSRNVPIGLRVSEKELAIIDKKKDRARMTRTDYLIACAMGKQITLMEDLKPLLSEMKRVGNNLNQLTKLANMGRITEVNLIETWEALNKIYVELHRLVREKGGDGEWQSS